MTVLLTPKSAVERARRYTRYPTGQCLNFVSNVLTNGAMLGLYAPYARHAWDNAQRKHHAAEGTPPPAGVPVYFDHGAANLYGHIAVSVGDWMIRSTDWPIRGHVSEVDLRILAKVWNRTYLGWSEDLYGFEVPGLALAPKPKAKNGFTLDGIADKGTWVGFQRWLKVAADGDPGPITMGALQRACKHPVTGWWVQKDSDALARLAGRPDLVGRPWSYRWRARPTAHTRALEAYLNRAIERGLKL